MREAQPSYGYVRRFVALFLSPQELSDLTLLLLMAASHIESGDPS